MKNHNVVGSNEDRFVYHIEKDFTEFIDEDVKELLNKNNITLKEVGESFSNEMFDRQRGLLYHDMMEHISEWYLSDLEEVE